ncbi:MAG TPA: ABC transporter permease [Cyclobacteriaceae bacterium]
MNKIVLIARQEFKNRVQKRSFLIATILIPLLFPALMGIMIYMALQQERNATKEVVHYLDESGLFKPENDRYIFKSFTGSLEDAKRAISHDNSFGLLYIPRLDVYNPKGVVLYTKVNPGPNDIGALRSLLEDQLKETKMRQLRLDQGLLDSLSTHVNISTVTLTETGQEQASDSNVRFAIGMLFGLLMYLFIFIYGAQIMQGIIEEKTNKVVEVIVSAVRPFQLMMGKILGLASVGLLQFLIWIILISTLSGLVFILFGIEMPQQQMAREMTVQSGAVNPELAKIIEVWNQIPLGYMIANFVFYFLGGYLIYGALFAAVGSAVDSPSEAQQFMFPITIPMLISYFSLFIFILQDPHGPISVWLSVIPFTSPIAMMGRVAFGVPGWQLALSMVLLVGGFVLTTWVAARIYRVGILMHGAKVSYKVLARWFLMKN